MTSPKAELTVLSDMAGNDLQTIVQNHLAWKLKCLDIKNGLFGKSLTDLRVQEAEKASNVFEEAGLVVHTLSTSLMSSHIEEGEAAFRRDTELGLLHMLALAKQLKPRWIRLIACKTQQRDQLDNAIDYMQKDYPWIFELYGEAIQRIHEAGFKVLIENEIGGCVLSTPREVHDFFTSINNYVQGAKFTWDIQNLWQEGTFPTLDVYESLKPLIGMIHLKGGQSETPGGPLKYASSLKEADWPVCDIVNAVLESNVSPVICLNPSHGERLEASVYDYYSDICYLREQFNRIT